MDSAKSMQIVREIDFVIQIRDKDSGYSELREILITQLTRFENSRRKSYVHFNPIFDFLKINIEKSVALHDNTNVFISNYREKKDSFDIEFSVVIIAPFLYFGSIRQAMDKLIKVSIADYFEELLEQHFPVNISVHSNDKTLAEPNAEMKNSVPTLSETASASKSGSLLSVILSSLALLISLLVLMFSIINYMKLENFKKELEWKDKYYEILIDKKLNDRFNADQNVLKISSTGDTTLILIAK